MLWNASALKGYAIEATDGPLGTVSDFLFNDSSWVVRWLVVETGRWRKNRQVLLPPSVLGKRSRMRKGFSVDLARNSVKNSPSISVDEPVSRQMETEIYSHYGWPPYWLTEHSMGGTLPSAMLTAPLYVAGSRPADSKSARGEPRASDRHLRSTTDVSDYRVHASDGEIGKIDDFLIDDTDWGVSYIKADAGSWWSRRYVLLTPRSVMTIAWDTRQVNLAVSRLQVKNSPPYTDALTVDKDYETRLHDHYGYRWSGQT